MYVSLITYTVQKSRMNPVYISQAKGAPECTTEVHNMLLIDLYKVISGKHHSLPKYLPAEVG